MRKFIVVLLMTALCVQVASAIDPPALASPTGMSAPDVLFDWNAVAGATWYRIWVSSDAAPGSAVVDDWVENDTFLNLTALEALAAGDYTCWLQSWGAVEGYSAWSGGFTFSVGVLKELVMPPSAFQSKYNSYNWLLNATELNVSSSGQYWYAPLYLPIGAEIESIYFYAYNDGALPASAGPKLTLYRRDVTTGNGGTLATIDLELSTASGRISGSDTTVSQPTVASGYAYVIRVYFDNVDTDLRGVRVFYWGE